MGDELLGEGEVALHGALGEGVFEDQFALGGVEADVEGRELAFVVGDGRGGGGEGEGFGEGVEGSEHGVVKEYNVASGGMSDLNRGWVRDSIT